MLAEEGPDEEVPVKHPSASATRPDSAFRARSVGLEDDHAGETTLSLETSVVLQNGAPEHRDRITGGEVLERAHIGITVALWSGRIPTGCPERSVAQRWWAEGASAELST